MNIPDGWRLLELHETVIDGDMVDHKPYLNFTHVGDSIGKTPEAHLIVCPGLKWITQRPPETKPDKEWVNPWD